MCPQLRALGPGCEDASHARLDFVPRPQEAGVPATRAGEETGARQRQRTSVTELSPASLHLHPPLACLQGGHRPESLLSSHLWPLLLKPLPCLRLSEQSYYAAHLPPLSEGASGSGWVGVQLRGCPTVGPGGEESDFSLEARGVLGRVPCGRSEGVSRRPRSRWWLRPAVDHQVLHCKATSPRQSQKCGPDLEHTSVKLMELDQLQAQQDLGAPVTWMSLGRLPLIVWLSP